MPGSKIERIKRVTQMVEEQGRYPIGQEAGAGIEVGRRNA